MHFPPVDRPLQLVVASSDGVLSVCSSQDSGTWHVTRSHEVANNVTCMVRDVILDSWYVTISHVGPVPTRHIKCSLC
jgi:hypothetical protein